MNWLTISMEGANKHIQKKVSIGLASEMRGETTMGKKVAFGTPHLEDIIGSGCNGHNEEKPSTDTSDTKRI